MPTVSEAQKRLALAAAHTPGGFGGMSQKTGLDFMHGDQAVGRVGKAGGGALPNPFPGARHVENAIHMAGQMAREHFAGGGQAYMPPHPGFGEIGDYRSILSPTAGGVIASEVPGRTDHIPTSVAADSYVIPADVVSGLGEGNTLAGARIIQEWMGTGPYGTPIQRSHGSPNFPHPPPAPSEGGTSTTTYKPHFADGGMATGKAPLKTAQIEHDPSKVPVIVAGGEMLLDPHTIAYHPDLGNLNPNDTNPEHYRRAVNFGHKVLDRWVVSERKKTVKTLSKLPGPKRK